MVEKSYVLAIAIVRTVRFENLPVSDLGRIIIVNQLASIHLDMKTGRNFGP